jgi:hypothetical protein
MNRSNSWMTRMRKPVIALGAAIVLAILASVDTTFAQVSFHRDLTLTTLNQSSLASITVSMSSNAPALTGDQALMVPTTTPPMAAGLVDLGTVPAVSAHQMSLVALASEQVQLAKSPEGAQQVAQTLVDATYKWDATQMTCLDTLWSKESHWNFQAHNYRSGAHGIAQAMPADKMEVIAMDWRTNPITQIKWGLRYISVRYGTPCKALAKHNRTGNY